MYYRVCPAKYRRVVFDTSVDTVLKEVYLDIAKRYAIIFLEIGTDKAHVHFLMQSIPTYSPTKIVKTIKSITAREVLKRVPAVKKQLWGGEFWSNGYFISTVGRHGNEEVIRQYVKQQGSEKTYKKLHRGHNALWADLGNVSLSSRASALGSRGVSATFDHFPLVIDDSIGRVPNAPYSHLCPAVGTLKRIAPRALLVALPVGPAGDDLDRAFDDLLHLGQRRLNDQLDLDKRLVGLHPIIPDALEPFRHHVLHHPANKPVDRDRFVLHPVGPVRAVMICHPLPIVAINAPDGDRWTHHVFGHVAGHTLRLRGDSALLHVGHQPVGILPETRIHQPGDRFSLERLEP